MLPVSKMLLLVKVSTALLVVTTAVSYQYPYTAQRAHHKPNIYDQLSAGIASPQVTGFPVFPPPISTAPPGIVTPPGTTYICVPAGTCATSTANNNIDIRIVTPTGPPAGACPAGMVPCYQVAGGVACGSRYATGLTTADGPSAYGAFPWQAYVLNQNGYNGSGVLIDQWHVLTAAHKVVDNQQTPGNIRVYMGVWNQSSIAQAQQRTAASIILHPNFLANRARLFDDIAIIRLSQPIALGYQTNIGSACMPTVQGQSFVNAANCIVSGWGQTGFGTNDAPTNPQKQVTVRIVDYNTCRTAMSDPSVLGTNVNVYLDPNGEICAGGEASKDACTQDGGAPLVCPDASGRYTVAGLVIWGKGCGRANVYGVYVNVPYYKTWIDQTVASLNAGK